MVVSVCSDPWCRWRVGANGLVVAGFWREPLNLTSLSRVADKLIGVHCTHGLNRTGYLVCR